MTFARLALITLACAGLMMLSVSPVSAFDKIPTMTVAELEPGMTGIGKTVIIGTEISEFNFEVLGILDKGGFTGGAMILVRCWGPTIDASGGIAGGYSGSPLYIDGKLIGAIAAGWPFSEGDVGGVTPIHDMLKTFNYPGANGFWEEAMPLDARETPLVQPIKHGGREFEKLLLLGSERDIIGRNISDDTLVLIAAKTPLVVGGVSDRCFPLIKKELEDRMPHLTVLQGTGSGKVPMNMSYTGLEPGAAIGVSLVTGDIDMTAIGTLTYIDEQNRILAFGHPFFQGGFIDMPLTTAKIVHTLPSLYSSFKMGQALEIIGSIEQDRGTCVAGILGVPPDLMDVTVTVIDEDLEWKNVYECRMIRDEELMGSFWSAIPMQGILQTLDRQGGGNMIVEFDVEVEGFDEPIHMDNVFYAEGAYGAWYAVSELSMIIGSLTVGNVYRDAEIESIDMTVTIRDENTSLNIIRANSIMPEREDEDLLDDGEDIEGGEFDEFENGEEAEQESAKPSSCVLLKAGKTVEFIKRYVPDRALVYLSRNPIGREIIKLNAGEEVLEAVDEYIEGQEEEEEDFYEVPQYYPGETIEATVIIRPYRQETFEQHISLEIPEDYPTGTYDISIYGGSGFLGGYYDPLMSMFNGGGYYGGYNVPETIEEVIEELMDREPSTSLVISLASIYSDDPYGYLKEDYEEPEEINNIYTLDGVVTGMFYLPIEIISEDPDDEMYDEDYSEFDEEFFEEGDYPDMEYLDVPIMDE